MIEVKNIYKTYDGINNVVDNLSLTIPDGSVFGFLGPNGAGKTTTIKMLVGINKPDRGEIFVSNQAPSVTSARENIGFMPEEPHFYDQLSGLEFLEFSGRLFKKSRNKSVPELEQLLRKVNMYEARNNKIKTYSKGMKQRLGFAQALINDPSYIFLDEPLEGLDPIGRRELKVIIEDIKRRGKTIFFNSHILADVETICDQIGIIHKGKLVYCGPVDKFKGSQSLEDKFVETIKSISK